MSTDAIRASDRIKILIVDDDDALREMLREFLEAEGYSVATAANGVLALRILKRSHPRLVLLDRTMPVLDGPAFARAARVRGLRCPILVMTASVDPHRIAMQMDAAGYLAKPFELIDLLAAVERLLAA